MYFITNTVVKVYKSSFLPTKRCELKAGQVVNVTDSRFGRDYIDSPVKGWIDHGFLRPHVSTDPLPPPLGSMERLKYHSQIAEGANTGSFGIVPFSATPNWNKAHSVILPDRLVELYRELQSQEYYDANIHLYPCDNPAILNVTGTKRNPADSFRWLFEHEDNKFYGAHYNGAYRIPAQGCFGGNLVVKGKVERNCTEVIGVTIDKLPTISQLYNRPDLVHFCWCVGSDGRTINPKCDSAFVLVLNPVGLQGVTNRLNPQTKIWIQNRWMWT